MIGFLKGTILEKKSNQILMLTEHGVGYEVHVSAPFFLELTHGTEQQLFTYLKVAENALELFGFKSIDDKRFFELLLTVNGIGPRSAINILGLGSLEQIQSAIARGDVAYLTQVSGIGKKTAERLCVELKNKVGNDESGGKWKVESGKLGEVVEALVGMGYSRDEARDAVKDIEDSGTTETLIRKALQRIK